LMDGQDAYEQIRVDPADVHKTLMTTPDGTMVSEVLQQGDTNAVATFMAVMTNPFLPFIGVWLEIYLDDIVIYTASGKPPFAYLGLLNENKRKQT
jgi:hypothetical protein